jgi:hypothetical protein
MELKDNEKLCPKCQKVLTYSSNYHAKLSIIKNSPCLSCSQKGKILSKEHKENIKKNHADVSGENNPMFGKSGFIGKKHTKESLEKISNGNKGKIFSKESSEKLSKSLKEYYKTHNGTTLGKKHTNETKNKMRLSAIKRISIAKFEGNQFYPSYNKKSIQIIEEYSIQNNFNIIHAENGGEYYIEKLGYWLDGYDIEKNIVIEFNEKHHNYRTEKDTERRENIINFLKCDFIIINEDLSICIIKFSNE